MRLRIDSMAFADHPAVRDGTFSCIPTARMYEFPSTWEGDWGDPDAPEAQAARVAQHWDMHPWDARWVYFKGFGQPMLDCGAVYGGDTKYGPSADEVVRDFERDSVDINRVSGTGRNDLAWLERFFAALPVMPEVVHLDAEWYYGFWEFDANAERRKVLPLMGRSKRALSRLPDVAAACVSSGEWTREGILQLNRHGARLTGTALHRVFAACGYTGPLAAFGYWNGTEQVKDSNGWPITAPLPDGVTGCYGAYDDNEPGTIGRNAGDKIPPEAVPAFAAALATRANENPENQVVTLRAFDPVEGLATSYRILDSVGCTDAVLWASPDPNDRDQIWNTLTNLAASVRV